MESSFFDAYIKELDGFRSKYFDDELFYELEVACARAFLLYDLVLGV